MNWRTLVVLGALTSTGCSVSSNPAAEGLATTLPATTTVASTTTETAPASQVFESRLDFLVELPAEWSADTSDVADFWSESMTGGDGEFFRVGVHDHPDRAPFVESVPTILPSLEEAVAETAALFPDEFGTDPSVGEVLVDGRVGYGIRPSADSPTPDTVTYIFDAPVTVAWRFIEFSIAASHDAAIMASLRWLPPPDDWIDPGVHYRNDRMGRRTVEDLLDLLAAGEWDIAGEYLLSENSWPGPAVAERIGEHDPLGESLGERLAAYCGGALCDAPFTIGGSHAVSSHEHVFDVTFDTADGPVLEPMTVTWFEAEATVASVPPLGRSAEPAVPLDVRVFGESYDGDLAVLRYSATEYLSDGERTWSPYRWHLVTTPRHVAGEWVVAESHSFSHGAVAPERDRVVLAETPAVIVGAATPDGVALVFVADDDLGRRVSALDPEGLRHTVLFDLTNDEGAYAVDASADRLVVLLAAGESSALEVYEFDPEDRAVGARISRIEPEGYVGAGHLAPDGATLAATLDPSFYSQPQTIAIIDAEDGTVLGSWSLEADAVIDSLDYDGRFVVAQLTGGAGWIIDTADGSTRHVATHATVRFR